MDRLRYTGMSIAQMREYTTLVKQGDAALKQRRALLAAHQARTRATIARWTQALALIDAKIEFYDEWVADGQRPAVEPHRRLRQAESRQAESRKANRKLGHRKAENRNSPA
jgi:DNA-binding transcriptional MerR regulator